jgi:rare lipoprotein A
MMPLKTLTCAFVCSIALPCGYVAAAQPPQGTTPRPAHSSPKSPVAKGTQTGVATVISKRFEGRKTASGDIYDGTALTAAHPSYPLGTLLRVTNLTNGKTVDVRIVDRTARGRRAPVVDLSAAAAQRLELGSRGRVRTEVMSQ